MRLTGAGRVPGRSDAQFCRTYVGTSSTLRNARNDAVEWLAQHGLDGDLQERAALVLSELATNALQASPGSDYGVQLSVDGEGAAIISLTSHTEYEQPPPRKHWGPPSLHALRGRGLLIVSELADDVTVGLPSPDTIVVTATLH